MKHVSDAETEAFLRPLPVGDLYGIRRAQAETLRRFGTQSIGQLAALPATTALRVLGRHGRVLQERARGTDHRAIAPSGTPRSCSLRADLAQDVLDGEQLRTTAACLAAELGGRLRLGQQAAGAMSVMVRLAAGRTVSTTWTVAEPSGHTDVLRGATDAILDGFALQRADPPAHGRRRTNRERRAGVHS
ncbi:hypothetical protein ACN2WE_40515 [Streptomyces sp. cg28]|uniref:DinB/UmuC family translesion DNA polymerase n=1 Tax=Streptomyces sp. cg28 TaxID=3403457 RepID=UPI003B21833A